MSPTRPGRFWLVVELLGLFAVCVGCYDLAMQFRITGYLPAPFVFDVGDTFMDWFNTAYWAHHPGAYEVWNSVYAPLSFVLLQLFGDPRCYAVSAFDARDCDTYGIIVILLLYLACVVVSAMAFRRNDRTTWMMRTLGIALGGPLLFSLERGNLIMFAYILFVLLYGGFLKSPAAIAIGAAGVINLKSYLILPILALATQRKWRLLELSAIATIAMYTITLAWIGEGTPFQIAHDLEVWFNMRAGAIWDELLYTTTYKPYLLFDARGYPIRDYVEQRIIDLATIAIQVELVASRGIALLAILAAWLYPQVVPVRRVAMFALMQSFLMQNPGGYAITFVAFLVFMERERSFAVVLAVLCCYLVSIPTDVTLTVFYHFERAAWLSGRMVDAPYTLPLGALIRPGLLLIAMWSLAIDSLIAVHRHMRLAPPQLGLAPRLEQLRKRLVWA